MALPYSTSFTVASDTVLNVFDGSNWGSVADNADCTVVNGSPDNVQTTAGAGSRVSATSVSPANADYYVEITGQIESGTAAGDKFGVALRHDGNVKASSNCFTFHLDGTGNWFFGKYVSGSWSQITTGPVSGYTVATYYTLRLDYSAGSNAYVCTIDTVEVDSGTNASHTAAGEPGLFLQRNAHVTWFEAAHEEAASGLGLVWRKNPIKALIGR